MNALAIGNVARAGHHRPWRTPPGYALATFASALVFCSLLTSEIFAQSWDYGEEAWSWEDISSSGTKHVFATSDAQIVLLPFDVPWFGHPTTQVAIASKGYVIMGGGAVSPVVAGPLGDLAAPNDVVAPLWADLDPAAGGAAIYTDTLGTAPWRRFVVQWDHVPYRGTALTNTFQLVVHEGTGFFEVKLANVQAGRAHTIGLENDDGSDALLIDQGSGGFFERAWVLQGQTTLDAPECGQDSRYHCFLRPYSFDSVIDEIVLEPNYFVELDYNFEWQDVPAESRHVVTFADFNVAESSPAIALPFPIRYYEADQTQVTIGDHGYVSFVGSADYRDPQFSSDGLYNRLPPTLPTVGHPTDGIVAPAWAWWAPEACGEVSWGTVGAVGDRRFVVIWEDVCTWAEARWGYDLGHATFQVVFYEQTGEIRFNFKEIQQLANARQVRAWYEDGTIPINPSWTFDMTVGVEDLAGTEGVTIVGSDSPSITTGNLADYTYRLTWQDRPGGVGEKLFITPFKVDPSCQDAVARLDASDGMFPFGFYDMAPTDEVFVSANGLLGFLDEPELGDFEPALFPTMDAPNAILSPAWTDYLPCGGGTVAYTFRGEGDGRTLVVQWDGIPQEDKVVSGTMWFPSTLSTTQAILHRGSGTIEFNIRDISLRDVGTDLAIGVEDGSGSSGMTLYYDPAGSPRFYNTMSRTFVRHCEDSAVTLGEPCEQPDALVGVCGQEGVWTCVAGETVCSQAIFPTAEACNSLDDDCDGSTDEGALRTFWLDADGDGFGGDLASVQACEAPPGFVDNRDDCNDEDAAIHPGADEVCNYVDDDCDGLIDEDANGVALGLRVWLIRDADGDTFGAGPPVLLCPGDLGADNALDCDDTDAGIHPGATEVCDGRDNDCDGLVDVGAVDVGVTCIDPTKSGRCAMGASACIDGHLLCQSIGPAPEVCDGDDNDCDGVTDEVDDAPASHMDPEIGLYLTFDQRTDATVIDLAGEPDNGTLVGATRLPDGGRYLDGVHVAPRQYVAFTDGAKHETDLANYDTFTLALWLKVDRRPTGNYVIMEREHQFRIRMVGGEPTFHAIGVSPPREYRAFSGITTGAWNHIAFVYDGAQVSWFINGVAVMTYDDVLDPFTPADSPLTIGSNAADGMEAAVDEFILWRHALTTEEVDAIYVPPGRFEAYAPGGNVRCDTGKLGICAAGATRCSAPDGYVMVCEAPPALAQELCNGLDDDCDGETDEPNTEAEVHYGPQGGGSCDTGQLGVCRPGRTHCIDGSLRCVRDVDPTTDLCDGLDNDCDGSTDEDDPEVGLACQTGNLGICGPGKVECVSTGFNRAEHRCLGIPPGSLAETCDGADEDCDGLIDENDDGTALSRTCGCFDAGTQTCINGEWDRCTARYPVAEVCDGVDNDCDGETDEGILRGCSSVCGDGVQACVAGGWASCTAPEPRLELCNGLDDDCDSLIDEDLYCGCKVYPTGGDAEPEVTWTWAPGPTTPQPAFRHVVGTPLVAPLYETNFDGIVNTDDRPMVVVMTAHEDDPTLGVLRVVDGRNGTLRQTLDALHFDARATPAIAELNGGVRADIVAYVHPSDGGGVALFESTGAPGWHNTEVAKDDRSARGALAVGELDGTSPLAEIAGCNFVITRDGVTLWVNHDLPTSPYCSPTLVDLDEDGALEVVIGGVAWRGQGQLMWQNPAFIASNGGAIDAPVSVADLDNDGAPDLVLVSGDVWVLEGRTGTMKARIAIPGGGRGGQAHLADVNGDGRVEIVVAGTHQLTALQYVDTGVTRSLQALWTRPIDDADGVGTATSMDLTNDGIAEVVFTDARWLTLSDGHTGQTLYALPSWGRRHAAMPVIADVTEDGEANILVVFNSIGDLQDGYSDGPQAPPLDRLTALRGARSVWPQTREVFNERSYHITNIQDDLRPPRQEAPHWKDGETNVFGANIVTNAAQFDAPDLTLAILDFGQGDELNACPAWNALTLDICNVGDVDVPAGLEVRLTADPPPIPGWSLTRMLPWPLPHSAPNNCESFVIEFAGPANGLFSLTATVDPGDLFAECREGNNQATRPLAWLQPPTDEVCDGLDNDCDGLVDADADGAPLLRPCASICGSGSQTCTDGHWSACSVPSAEPEVCDGLDNDFDGLVDEEEEACMAGQTCICQIVEEQRVCGCVDTLTVPTPCMLGCPLGTACNGESCEPWCDTDDSCPTGERCLDHLCTPAGALGQQDPSPVDPSPTRNTCDTTPAAGSVGGGLGAATVLLGLWMLTRRR